MKSQNERIDIDADEAREIAYKNSLRGRLFLLAMEHIRDAALQGKSECTFTFEFDTLGQAELDALHKLEADLAIRGYKGNTKAEAVSGGEVLCAGAVIATVEVRWHE